MSFKDIKLNAAYDSDQDDIVEEFYIPTLSEAKSYDRLAGFFSSSALYVAARGIAQFIKNGGKMRLIAGAKLRKNDVEAIIRAKEKPEEIISNLILQDLNSIENELVLNHVKAFAWMIANGFLDIKVGILTDENGRPLADEEAAKTGLFHQKVGILTDEEENILSFSGSVNESATAWVENVEEFKVFRSWVEGESDHLGADREKFERYWSGKSERLQVMEVPRAVREKLVSIAPADFEPLSLRYVPSKSKRKLRAYQSTAISKWLNNNRRGIFEMATGTGKTITALSCLDARIKSRDRFITVIAVPYTHLVEQWSQQLPDFGLKGIETFGSATSWKTRVTGTILDFNNGHINNPIFITTHATFSGETFMTEMKKVEGKLLLIADEVHGLGAPERQVGLMEIYTERLGLSATPKRYFDDIGTARLDSFFDKTVFEFSLQDAIRTIDPSTGKTYLTPYEFRPYFVGLDYAEMEEYNKQTRKIARAYSGARGNAEKQNLANLFSIIRQRIILNASEKYATVEKILSELGNISHCLIYCSPQQIKEVQDILNKRHILQHKFTAQENPEQRRQLLLDFESGKYSALVAMRCLDEGVDVKPARIAIMMANSGNPKEFIQRRGRVLRRSPDKEKAIIYDIIVVPSLLTEIAPGYKELESKIMRSEIKRYVEFAQSALNSGEAILKIVPYATKYGIVLGGDHEKI